METHGQKIYGFYDGDFTFHYVEYDHEPSWNGQFRARIDNESAEERMLQNVGNLNSAPAGWTGIRPATEEEAARWLYYFKALYPLRPQEQTDALRFLRLNGPTKFEATPPNLSAPLHMLTRPILRHREFQGDHVRFVSFEDETFALTDEGLWLTGLMK